ncbi:MAG: DUF269 domain-containing protein [Prochloraceae cyanobacterium]
MIQAIELAETKQSDLFEGVFLQEFVRQVRHRDTRGIFSNCDDLMLVSSLLFTSESERENKDIDLLTNLRVSAFFWAVATIIERETGHMTETFINLTSKKLSSALVFCGGVLVVYQIIRKLELFEFESIDGLTFRASMLITNALAKAGQYLDCTP